jgi:flavin-dependent dehydrogenase
MAINTEYFDVVIVGARCAGAPLGALLARRGVKVAVLEQAVFPRDTISSHVMQADALAFLDRLGVTEQILATGAALMTRVDARLNDFQFTAPFPRHLGDVAGAACIRRFVLDPILAEAAVAAGADVRMATKVTGLVREGGRVTGVRVRHRGDDATLRARLVVGADGRNSTVARLALARAYNLTRNERVYYWTYFSGADLSPEPTFVFHRWGDRHIFAGPADHGLYIVGVSPQAHERAAFKADPEAGLMAHVRSCAPVATALSNARRATKIYGISRFTGYFREPTGPGWVLTGDSGHFKDPAAGRGIGDAFRQAEVLAPLIVDGLDRPDREFDDALVRWGRGRDRKYAQYYRLAADIGAAGALPAVVPRLVQRLHARGRVVEFLELFSHRVAPTEVVTPARVLGSVASLLSRSGSDRGALLRETAGLLARDTRHRWLARHPIFAGSDAAADPAPRRATGSGYAGPRAARAPAPGSGTPRSGTPQALTARSRTATPKSRRS